MWKLRRLNGIDKSGAVSNKYFIENAKHTTKFIQVQFS